jgi:hypothetical protein
VRLFVVPNSKARWGGVDGIEDPYLNVNVLWPAPLSLRLD